MVDACGFLVLMVDGAELSEGVDVEDVRSMTVEESIGCAFLSVEEFIGHPLEAAVGSIGWSLVALK